MGVQQTFANNMRRFRKKAHLSQEQLAERAGLHRTYIGGIEQRRINVSLKNIEKIAMALEVNPADLFQLEEDAAKVKQGAQAKGMRASCRNAQKPFGAVHRAIDEKFGNYAICEWHGENATFFPVEVTFEDLTVQILCELVERGYRGEKLAKQYRETNREIIDFLKKSKTQ